MRRLGLGAAYRAIDPSSGRFAATFSRKGRRGNRTSLQDQAQDVVGAALDLGVGHAQDAEALAAQPGVADRVGGGRVMVGTAGLDDQAVAQADEVGDVAADRDLAAELEVAQAAIAEEFP